ncbi:MAG: hypothetical protein Q4E91_12950 [Lachnospiraceae bacterium]|nr:hypothetical protein [Lachnospiraceae bacterium]
MKKNVVTLMTAAVMTAAMTMTAFAGEWKQDAQGWWWQNDNGTYPNSGWEWLDGNKDGVSECYFFGNDGYLLVNTTVEGQYTVNADGAWVADGVVQTKAAEAAAAGTQEQAQTQAQYGDDYSGNYQVPFYEMDGSVTTQTLSISFDALTNSILVTSSRSGVLGTYTYGGTDFRGYTFFELESEEEKDAIFYLAPGQIEWWTESGSTGITRQ